MEDGFTEENYNDEALCKFNMYIIIIIIIIIIVIILM